MPSAENRGIVEARSRAVSVLHLRMALPTLRKDARESVGTRLLARETIR